MKTIVIIGGGFSGTLLAVRLLRAAPRESVRLRVIERRARLGDGVAYALAPYPYLLNVPAGRMSASADAPGEFLDFVRRRDPLASGEDFVPRSWYGDYLRELLDAATTAARGVVFDVVRGVARDLIPDDRTGGFRIQLQDQGELAADRVVLCTGAPPATLSCMGPSQPVPAGYVADPYAMPMDFTAARSILVVGTGLTMADIALAAAAQNPDLRILALSRHGLLPLAQSAGHGAHGVAPERLEALIGLRPDRLTRAVRQLADELQRGGGDWRDLLMGLRPVVARIWGSWSEGDRRRFLRHLRLYWDIHRHRMPPQTAVRVRELLGSGQLRIQAGSLLAIEPDAGSLRARWKARGTGVESSERFDRVVNCTGANCPVVRWPDPLMQSLFARGLAASDPLGLGLELRDLGALVDAQGTAHRHLHYLGPMLRAQHWEATAVLELRAHVEKLAAALTSGHVGPA
jgi:uncharacterized NAD(P)/FAD-binding protein YdhS